jgi:hypothetical protein
LILDDPAGFHGAITGLPAYDNADLASQSATFVSLSGCVPIVLVGDALQTKL